MREAFSWSAPDPDTALAVRGRIAVPAGAIDEMEAAAVETRSVVNPADWVDTAGSSAAPAVPGQVVGPARADNPTDLPDTPEPFSCVILGLDAHPLPASAMFALMSRSGPDARSVPIDRPEPRIFVPGSSVGQGDEVGAVGPECCGQVVVAGAF